jgi:hypothetical protein
MDTNAYLWLIKSVANNFNHFEMAKISVRFRKQDGIADLRAIRRVAQHWQVVIDTKTQR